MRMHALERLLRHDAWTTRSLLTLAIPLTDAQLDQEFDIGARSLRRTFVHIVSCMECWCDLMAGQQQRSGNETNRTTIADLTERLEVVAAELLALGIRVISEGREDEYFIDYLDKPPTRKPLGGALVHVATHGMHHRAQALYIMRKLGVTGLPEGDALGWEQQYLGRGVWPVVGLDQE